MMYTISLYERESITSILLSIMIVMAAIHFMFIVMYHIITYVHGGVMQQKMLVLVNKLAKCLNSFYNRQKFEQFKLEDLTHERIPEVTHLYDEFQEPLVGQMY